MAAMLKNATTYLPTLNVCILICYRVCGVEVCWQFYEKVSSISCNTRRNITKKVLDFSAEVESDVQFFEPVVLCEEVQPVVLEQVDGTPSWLPWTRKPIKSEKERNFVEICRHMVEGIGEPMPNQTISDPAGTGLVHTVVYINAGMPFVFFNYDTLCCYIKVHAPCIVVLQVCTLQGRPVSEMERSSTLHYRWSQDQLKDIGLGNTSGSSSSRNLTISPSVQSVRTTNSRFWLDNPSSGNPSEKNSFSIEPTSLTSEVYWTSSSNSLTISQKPFWSYSKMEWTTQRQTSLDWETTPKQKTTTTEMRSKRSSSVSVVLELYMLVISLFMYYVN